MTNLINKTLMTDLYEITMGQSYYDSKIQDLVATFDIFYRRNPFDGGYAISGGLEEIIDYIKNLKITDEDIAYLKKTVEFKDEFLKYLKDFKFTGDIYAIPDGTPIFPFEPVITVKAKLIEAQIVETALLACFNHGTLVTTSAKRLTNVTSVPVAEFGARRARGIASALEASKYGYIGGCCGTSNVIVGREYGITILGTMAHSYIQSYTLEYEAFLAYAKSFPNDCTLLVDTYNTLKSGIPNAIKVAYDYLVPNGYTLKGIRIDSGDFI